jgi:hypothetical protein
MTHWVDFALASRLRLNYGRFYNIFGLLVYDIVSSTCPQGPELIHYNT